MTRLISALALLMVPITSQVVHAQWVTLSGQVVYPKGEPIPPLKPINVTADAAHCNNKGPLMSDELLIDAKTRGLANVFIYLVPNVANPAGSPTFSDEQIFPELLKAKPVEHVIDQPCCTFIPRALTARNGDTLLVKNSSPVSHNINFASDSMSFNQNIIAGGAFTAPNPLMAQRSFATYACNIHPWMNGRMMIFDHPYHTVTDKEGNFTIKNAPAGAFKIFYRHQEGFHKGREGNKGFPVVIAAAKGMDQVLPPLEFILVK